MEPPPECNGFSDRVLNSSFFALFVALGADDQQLELMGVLDGGSCFGIPPWLQSLLNPGITSMQPVTPAERLRSARGLTSC